MRPVTARYAAWRLAQTLPTVFGIVLLVFLLVHLAPGDPVLALAGEHGDEGYYAFMERRFGLDRPLPERLGTFASRLLTGDVGLSYVQGRPAMTVVLERVPATLLLTATALVLSSILGLLLGLVGAAREGKPADLAITATTLGLYAAPVFWVGNLAILLLAFHLGLFPLHGMSTAGSSATGFAAAADVARHLALPALVLASQEVAAVARLTRGALLEELGKDYVRTARAKGLRERVVLARHALRRALLPVVTVIGSRASHLLGGAVIVEIVFAWPGMGRLMLTSLQARDMPILLGIFLLTALAVIVANLLTDLAYGRLDPRVRYR
jgi:peptide/nickel transport system permease protein